MKKFFAIAAKEWKFFFYTPFGLVILPLFLVLSGVFFFTKLDTYLQYASPSVTTTVVSGLNTSKHLLIPFFQDLLNVFVFIVPLMTMRTFAEEKKTGTFDLLVSYPLKPWQIVLGKYFGIFVVVLVLLGLSWIFLGFIFWKGHPFLPQIFSAYLGLLLFLSFYTAVGVLASQITENQFIAAIIAYAVFFATILIGFLAFISGRPWDRVFSNFLFVSHVQNFYSGLIFIGDVASYLCTTVFILVFAIWRLRKYYQRSA